MMPTSLADVISVILGLELLGAGTWISSTRAKRAEMRTKQLEIAASALKEHYSAAKVFLDADGAPDHLKAKLLRYSDLTADRGVARRLAELLCEEEPGPEDSALLSDLKQLQQERPELADVFGQAILTGVMGMFLQWPEAAALFDRFVARFAAHPSRETVVVASGIARVDRAEKSGGGPLGGRAAFA